METGPLYVLLISYCERNELFETSRTLSKQQNFLSDSEVLCLVEVLEDIHRCET